MVLCLYCLQLLCHIELSRDTLLNSCTSAALASLMASGVCVQHIFGRWAAFFTSSATTGAILPVYAGIKSSELCCLLRQLAAFRWSR